MTAHNTVPKMASLPLQLALATQSAAIAAAKHRGRGDEEAADEAAAEAMSEALAQLQVTGHIVIGEGEKNEVPFLHVDEEIGQGGGPTVDLAVDALEGTTICAKSLKGALSVVACAERGKLLKVPDIYMDKIAIGPGYDPGLIDLDAPVADNLKALADAKGVPVRNITACVLDRPRHSKLIDEIRDAGAAIRLIGDGDITAIINTADPEETFIDIYLGKGDAPAGILAAAALRCIGGQMQGRLAPMKEQDYQRAHAAGIEDVERKYSLEELAGGDVIFATTGVTNGSINRGVKFYKDKTVCTSRVMDTRSSTIHSIETEHVSTAG